MGWLSDLWIAMATRRANRIDAAEADRLLAGQPTPGGRAGVAALLSEASAAARPEELAGEAAAVEDYLRVRSAIPSALDLSRPALSTVELSGRSPWYGPSPARTLAVRVAVAVVLLAGIGTVTVHFGYLPIRMQQIPGATSPSSASVPSPSPSSPEAQRGPHSQPSVGALPGPTGRTGPTGSTGPATGPTGPATDSTGPATGSTGVLAAPPATTPVESGDPVSATALCQAWMDNRNDKPIRDELAQELRPLMATLDGPDGIPAFCRKLLNLPPPPTGKVTAACTTPTSPASPTTRTATSPAKATKSPASGTAPATATTAPPATATGTAAATKVNKSTNNR